MKSMTRPSGFSLIEVLVAFSILAFGMLALVKLQTSSTQSSSLAKARTEAIAAAEEKIEALRNFPDYTALASGSGSDTLTGTNASMSRDWNITETSTAPAYKTLVVNVVWQSRTGENERVSLTTFITDPDPEAMAMLLAEETTTGTGTGATDEQTGQEQTAGDIPSTAPLPNTPTAGPEEAPIDDPIAILPPEEEVMPSTTSITISGAFTHHGGSGIQVSNATISGNYSGDCSYTDHSYICEITGIPAADSWTGQVSISSNKSVCNPPDNPTPYSGITTSLTQNYNLGKQTTDCP